MDITKKESSYFFCYDRKVAEHLRYEHGIRYITSAKHISSDNIFYLFEKTPELQEALDQLK